MQICMMESKRVISTSQEMIQWVFEDAYEELANNDRDNIQSNKQKPYKRFTDLN